MSSPIAAIAAVLAPTDFSPGAERALRVSVAIARETGATLTIAHAWFIPRTAYSAEEPLPDGVESVIANARRALDAAVSHAAAGGVRARGKLLAGPAWRQIVNELDTGAYDLCVVGTAGRTGLARVLLGSVAEKVVRHGRCSVLVARPGCEPGPFRHALVPTDFSACAAVALDIAVATVQNGGVITLLHVIEVTETLSEELGIGEVGGVTRATAGMQREIQRVDATGRLAFETSMTRGYAGAEILDAIDANRGIDLVVIGSNGRTGLQRAFMGSVAENVARHARCPVLVAR